jgi:UPF0755 protein
MRRVLLVPFVVCAIAITLSAGYVWRDLHTAVVPPAGGALVSVRVGAPFRSIAEQLHGAGVLRHPFFLSAWARSQHLDRRVQSGDYRITQPVTPLQLLELLQSSSLALHWVTIPEGYTARQVAVALEQAGFGGRDVFRCVMESASLLRDLDLPGTGVEGFLFPDTYALAWAIEPETAIRTMVARFREQSASLAEIRLAAGLTEVEMVTLASLIEKETGRAEERPLIAGVFHNRLRLGMPLQSDPTVIYGLEKFGRSLTRGDLSDRSPYNTYTHAGLPPGPIANPGRAALEAAVSPAVTDALYFVSRNDGSHEFSANLADHNRAVRRYQRSR